MNRPKTVRAALALLAACCLAAVAASAAPAAAPAKPNVLIILADDLGFSDIGCYGSEIETPNLDRLAAEGVRFTRFYNEARCWTTRTALATGYHAKQLGADPDLGAAKRPKWSLPLPRILGAQGYRTYHSGKWHVLADGCASAHAAGFDRAYDFAQGYLFFTPKHHALDGKILPRPKIGDGYFMDVAVADRMIGFLQEHGERHSGTPFFAYLCFNSPHYPLKAPQSYIDKYKGRYDAGWDAVRAKRFARQMELGFPKSWKLSEPEGHVISTHSPQDQAKREEQTRRYGFEEVYSYVPWETLSDRQKKEQAAKMEIHAAMVDLIDVQVGRVLGAIEALGALDDTLVVFLSDNGADCTQMLPDVQMPGDLVYEHDPAAPWGSEMTCLALGPAWASAANAPFRRHKIWTHEGGIATPMVARWPRGISAEKGGFVHETGSVLDFVPTLLELAGQEVAPPSPDAPPYPGTSLVPAFRGERVARGGPLFLEHVGNRALIEGAWKLVSSKTDGGRWELYNLEEDRSETSDLAAQFPERVSAMAAQWGKLHALYREQGGYPPPAVRRE
jgi:arylsulfatase